MRNSSLVAPLLLGALAVSLVACSAEPETPTSSDESAQTSVYSCRAKREAAASAAHEREAQSHWRYLLLGVMQPVAGVPSIRERMDLAPESDELGRRMDAFYFAKEAAGADGLLSVERIVAYFSSKYGVALSLDAFQTDGSYSGDWNAIRGEANGKLRLALFLVRHFFAIAEIGVTEGDVAQDAQRRADAEAAWQTVTLPITQNDGHSSLNELIAESMSGSGRAFCSTPAANGLKALVREADAKFGNDSLTSMSELSMFFAQKHGATVTFDPWSVKYGAAGKTGTAYQDEWGLECALSLLRIAGRERAGVPSQASPGVVLGVAQCGTIDLLAHQGSGTQFTGSTATTRMGEKQYEVVMMRASLLQPKIQELLCLEPSNVLKLYVPYGEHAISECAMVNGVYTAKHYGLTGFGYSDNWAAE